MSAIVIVGGGHAAGQAAATLRQRGHDGELVVVCNEPWLPYQRPPLSKQYLAGALERTHLYLRQQDFYDDRGIEVRSGVTVSAIDPAGRRLHTDAGESLDFSKLLLATGGRPRPLDVPGIGLAGIHYLRTIADADRIRGELDEARRVCVAGGGYIGLEVAAVAIKAGKAVTVLEAGERVLPRVATPLLSEFYTALHREHGVDVRVNAPVEGFGGDGRVESVVCGGERIETDLVIVGVGIEPNVELAAEAGLACDNGIVVDEHCRTAHPDIYAAGDCTNHPNPQLGRRLRLESVPNALDQARVASANMLGGSEVHDAVPWFWSDQYDLKLQMVGFSADGDRQVLRGDMREKAFAVFHLQGDRVVAVDAVNSPREFLAGKKLFGKTVDAEALADPAVETKTLAD